MKMRNNKIGGVRVNTFVMPLVIIVGVLYILIIGFVLEVNSSTAKMIDMLELSALCQQKSTNLQAGLSTLSETSVTFVQRPVTDDGSVNTGPLLTFADEMTKENRRSQNIAAEFNELPVSDEIKQLINDADEAAQEMFERQIHALSLVRSVYPLPDDPALNTIPDVPLTEEELEMPGEARLGLAKQIILGKDYSLLRYRSSTDIENCHISIQRDFAISSAKIKDHISNVRTGLWAVIFLLIILSAVIVVMFYRWIIKPLRIYAKLIESDKKLSLIGAVRELRLLASTYNDVLTRRDKLENILRSAAETDALTGMQNRYSLEKYLIENAESGESMAVILFDINYLKRVNDTTGHLAGDKLIKTSGECICECFGDCGAQNCFRIGGDEFASVLRGCTEDEVKMRIDKFTLALEREDISVSCGYSYAEKTDENSFKLLMNEADKRMYEQKKLIHDTGNT